MAVFTIIAKLCGRHVLLLPFRSAGKGKFCRRMLMGRDAHIIIAKFLQTLAQNQLFPLVEMAPYCKRNLMKEAAFLIIANQQQEYARSLQLHHALQAKHFKRRLMTRDVFTIIAKGKPAQTWKNKNVQKAKA